MLFHQVTLFPQIITVLFLASSTLAVPRTQVHLQQRGYWDTATNAFAGAMLASANTLLSSAAYAANIVNGDHKKPVMLDDGTIAQIPKANDGEIATIKEFSKLAKAAYDVDDEAHGPGHIKMMENWECEMCKDTRLTPDEKPLNVFADHATSTHVYITSFSSKKAIIVAFKGTDGKMDMFADAFAKPVSSELGGTVHAGFNKAFQAGRAFVMSKVSDLIKKHPDYEIVVTGHSLGGAIATLAAGFLSKEYPNITVRLITYCQPRVGDINFARALYKMPKLSGVRYIHYNDPVPHAPFQLAFKFVHYGTEYWSPKPDSMNILKCSPVNDAESEICSNAIYLDLTTTTVGYHSRLPGIQFGI